MRLVKHLGLFLCCNNVCEKLNDITGNPDVQDFLQWLAVCNNAVLGNDTENDTSVLQGLTFRNR